MNRSNRSSRRDHRVEHEKYKYWFRYTFWYEKKCIGLSVEDIVNVGIL